MGFHSNLGNLDLHAPSRLRVVNESQNGNAVGAKELAFVTRYSSNNGRYGVAPITDFNTHANGTTFILGFVDETLSTGAQGTMVTFGLIEGVSIAGVTAASRGAVIYVVNSGAATGTLTLNVDTNTTPIAVVVNGGNDVADLFVFSLQGDVFGGSGVSTRAFVGFYDPLNSTALPQDGASISISRLINPGDYFIATTADPNTDPNRTNAFNREFTVGDVLFVETPGGGTVPSRPDQGSWTAGDYLINNALGGGGTGFELQVDGGSALTSIADFRSTGTANTYGIDFSRPGTDDVDAAVSADLQQKIRRSPDPGAQGSPSVILSTGDYVLNVDNDPSNTTPETIYTWKETTAVGSAGRLEAIVVNSSGATLDADRAYSLENDVYEVDNNTITFTGGKPGIVTRGQTGLVWIETEILNGATGVGVLKGIITLPGSPRAEVERESSILATGTTTDRPEDGEYIIGTTLRSSDVNTAVEFAFDGLSNYQLRREGRLECDIENRLLTNLTAGRMYSLERGVYAPDQNRVSFSGTINGDTTDGQTGLVWIETTILPGQDGKGILKGIVDSSIVGPETVENDLKVDSNGDAVTATIGSYVVATSLRTPGSVVEIVFDGLANYKLVAGGGGSVTEVTGERPILVSNATTTPDITIEEAIGTAQGTVLNPANRGALSVADKDQILALPTPWDTLRQTGNNPYITGDQVLRTNKVYIKDGEATNTDPAIPVSPGGNGWDVVGIGDVTNVTGTAPIQVATGTTTPAITIDPAVGGTTLTAGSMSGADKAHLDAVPPLWANTDVTANLAVGDQRVFSNRLYINTTGMSRGSTTSSDNQPNNDTTNWTEVGTGDGTAVSYSDSITSSMGLTNRSIRTGQTTGTTTPALDTNGNFSFKSFFASAAVPLGQRSAGAGLEFPATTNSTTVFDIDLNALTVDQLNAAPRAWSSTLQTLAGEVVFDIRKIYLCTTTQAVGTNQPQFNTANYREIGNISYSDVSGSTGQSVRGNATDEPTNLGDFSFKGINSPNSTITVASTSSDVTLEVTNPFSQAEEDHLDAVPPLWTNADITDNLSIDDQRVFNGKLYINLTGMAAGSSTPANNQPDNDTTNWREVGVGDGSVTDVTGSVPIVITGTSTETPNVTITAATESAAGSMSAVDKEQANASPVKWANTDVTSNLSIGDQRVFLRKLYINTTGSSAESGTPADNQPDNDTTNWSEVTNGEINTNTNAEAVGANEVGLVNAKVGVNTPIKTIKGGTSIVITSDDTSVTIASTASASGEANTASNLGTATDGEGLFTVKDGVNLPFKRIKAGTNVTITSETNDIVINASGGGGTTQTTSFNTRDSGFRNSGGGRIGQSINFNVDNTGFIWDLNRLVAVTSIDGAPVNLPIVPPPVVVAGDFTNVSGTINGTTVTVDLTVTTSGNDSIVTIGHTGQIINTDVGANTEYVLEVTFTLAGVTTPFTLNSGTISGGGNLTYLAHPTQSASLTAPAVNFQSAISSISVNRSEALVAGSVVASLSTFPNGTFSGDLNTITVSPGVTNSTLPANRTMSESTTFTAAAGTSTDTEGYMAQFNPTFQFPVYLGSVNARSEVNTAALNNAAIFNQEGTFTSDPLSTTPRSFTWSNVNAPIKIFAIARQFTNGETLVFKDTASDPLGNQQAPFASIAAGSINTEIYDIYEAKTGQPGPAIIFVETT